VLAAAHTPAEHWNSESWWKKTETTATEELEFMEKKPPRQHWNTSHNSADLRNWFLLPEPCSDARC